MEFLAGWTHACGKKSKRECNFLIAGVVAVSFLVLVGLSALHLPEPFTIEPGATLPAVTLLVWTYPFGRVKPLPDCMERYGVYGCVLTDDKSAYPYADGVLMQHLAIEAGISKLPPEAGRPPGQKWIWFNYESPTNTHDLWRMEGLFNLTMTYRADSDIFLPYGYLVHKHGHGKPLTKPSRIPRPGFVVWAVSNWEESYARVAFYYELRKYIQIDVFGRAGKKITRGPKNLVNLLRHYYFYLALENSQHTDYITEKLWNAVSAGAVPVVLGPTRKDYERFLPPEAFIHVDDFPSVKELARYLLQLRREPARRMFHLSWRTRFRMHEPALWFEYYCTACKALRKTVGQTHVVHNLTQWFDS
ncbi:4-galactosyl-N-acetylglucosaminide 3-alpha-L-fucosyltransferase FUT5-like [Corythoichthys intestinalis]|uniref:4-galactosyl-N-acetylglucosaminide 3-alpha-L-fucosyltransferase FUT5-like n=1 Tax=Corythoichthys intestinalis TaxID=161448 RepID=UPI0025A605CE|nr:4-galactosyl-N-acetylglucosaminide 3-alpha-L-fucosyltransferase FUT5-like [Corythoichthys intestinalis]